MTTRVSRSVKDAANRAKRELQAQASAPGAFDASRYFRTSEPLGFLNVRTPVVRQLGKSIAREHRDDWNVGDATAFADTLIRDRHLEIKGVGIEVLACFHRQFGAGLLLTVKGWLAANDAANWATTDSICGALISPLLLAHPELVSRVASWAGHQNLWVRRASAVSLVRLAARGRSLDVAYGVAAALREDPHDLIHKAAGWLLRESGRTDPNRLRRYLLENGPSMPRTTIRYAIEHFSPDARAELLAATRSKTPAPRVTRATAR
jgi:3-methyladenine DNA glycosylase AlkD